MNRRTFVAVCGMAAVSVAGCVGVTPDEDEPDSTASSGDSSPQETPEPATQGSERQASPNEFIHVRKVRNETEVEAAKAGKTAHFENLNSTRQQTFLKARSAETVAANGWSYYNESRPVYVRYNGTWYNVVVGVH